MSAYSGCVSSALAAILDSANPLYSQTLLSAMGDEAVVRVLRGVLDSADSDATDATVACVPVSLGLPHWDTNVDKVCNLFISPVAFAMPETGYAYEYSLRLECAGDDGGHSDSANRVAFRMPNVADSYGDPRQIAAGDTVTLTLPYMGGVTVAVYTPEF